MVTQETLGTLIPFVTKKRKKKNYQEILSEYLNYLSSSGNKLSSISKEMKAQFFMNMNEVAVNKNDELKYLILMREEFYKYKLKIYYFLKWKCKVLYNRDLIDDENPFYNNNEYNYQQFKNMNSAGKEGLYEISHSSSKRNFNFSDNKDNNLNYNIYNKGENFYGKKQPYNINNNNNNSNNNYDLFNLDKEQKKLQNQNQIENPSQNQEINSLFDSLDPLKNKEINNSKLM